MDNEIIKMVAGKAGGMVALAEQLRITRSAIHQWKQVPANRVLEVERITGVSRYALRPDIFGKPPKAAK